MDLDPPAAVLVEDEVAAAVFELDVLPTNWEPLGVLALLLLTFEATTDEPALLATIEDPALLPPAPETDDPALLPAADEDAPPITEDPPALLPEMEDPPFETWDPFGSDRAEVTAAEEPGPVADNVLPPALEPILLPLIEELPDAENTEPTVLPSVVELSLEPVFELAREGCVGCSFPTTFDGGFCSNFDSTFFSGSGAGVGAGSGRFSLGCSVGTCVGAASGSSSGGGTGASSCSFASSAK